jgi:hypothetical protein
MFQFDPNYEQTEAEWDEIKKEILGEEAERMAQGAGMIGGEAAEGSSEEEEFDEDKNKKVSTFQSFDLISD